ncbi:MAG: bifunctional 4-hydroxy-2-oxoglutarate aldolase/2-dehydro-3-deoxy-phosphogluconate aldolase [Candidatus Omnitrophota bacterium]|nr:bifunctional 4-hydroxy-2-oxoglutarate aldolase/2-dehydro-3-deoxy-phosphogluconate aldolase [Candidatus Omnitrophota bacterium]
MDIEKFKRLPILGIMRGIDVESVEPLVEALISAGLKTVEITMNTRGAAALIEKAVATSGKRLTIGAGTVLSVKSLETAMEAGATFIVTPVLVEEVMKHCVKNKIPVFPGALTPSEIYNAWNAGATMVKVFPAGVFGPKYLKEIKGPFNDIRLLACGGVTPDNMKDYFSSGASAVAFGEGVFKREWLAGKDFKSVGDAVKSYVNAFENASQNRKEGV